MPDDVCSLFHRRTWVNCLVINILTIIDSSPCILTIMMLSSSCRRFVQHSLLRRAPVQVYVGFFVCWRRPSCHDIPTSSSILSSLLSTEFGTHIFTHVHHHNTTDVAFLLPSHVWRLFPITCKYPGAANTIPYESQGVDDIFLSTCTY